MIYCLGQRRKFLKDMDLTLYLVCHLFIPLMDSSDSSNAALSIRYTLDPSEAAYYWIVEYD
jgi:hypothetical protein